MGSEQNKAVVRRFITEVLAGGNLAAVDDVLAPGYVNDAMGARDRASFKEMLGGLAAALPRRTFDITELVAEGDAVVARFTSAMTDREGKTTSVRGLTYYKLAGGQIVEDDPITSPDLMQALAPLMSGIAGS